WSSDVCSADLGPGAAADPGAGAADPPGHRRSPGSARAAVGCPDAGQPVSGDPCVQLRPEHLRLPGQPGSDALPDVLPDPRWLDRKSTRLNSSHVKISYAVFCLKKKKR